MHGREVQNQFAISLEENKLGCDRDNVALSRCQWRNLIQTALCFVVAQLYVRNRRGRDASVASTERRKSGDE